MPTPSVPMANPVSSQSQPAPSISRSSFAIRAVSRRSPPPLQKPLSLSRGNSGGAKLCAFSSFAPSSSELRSVFVSTTPRQPRSNPYKLGWSNSRAKTQSVDFGRRPILLASGIRATAGWTVACSLTRTENHRDLLALTICAHQNSMLIYEKHFQLKASDIALPEFAPWRGGASCFPPDASPHTTT